MLRVSPAGNIIAAIQPRDVDSANVSRLSISLVLMAAVVQWATRRVTFDTCLPGGSSATNEEEVTTMWPGQGRSYYVGMKSEAI